MAPKNDRVAFSYWQAWFFSQIPNWEEIIDPNNPLHQIGVQSAIHELAGLVSDRAVRDSIQGPIKKSIANIAAKNAK